MDRTQDEEFADVLAELMLGRLSAAEAVRSWALLCRQRAVALREEASGQLQRAARYMHLRDEVTPCCLRLAHARTARVELGSCTLDSPFMSKLSFVNFLYDRRY